jgi:hypothetical protein
MNKGSHHRPSHLQIKGELPTRQHGHEHHMLQLPSTVVVDGPGWARA